MSYQKGSSYHIIYSSDTRRNRLEIDPKKGNEELCDSGINSLKYKTGPSLQCGDTSIAMPSSLAPVVNKSPPISRHYEQFTEKIRKCLQSDEVPSRINSKIFQNRESKAVISFTKNVIDALMKCVAASDGRLTSYTGNRIQWNQYKELLVWKVETMKSLLQEYEELVKKLGNGSKRLVDCTATAGVSVANLHVATTFATAKKRFSSLLSLLRQDNSGQNKSFNPLPTRMLPSSNSTLAPKPAVSNQSRLHELECQLSDLSGCLRLRIREEVIRGRTSTLAQTLNLKFCVAGKGDFANSGDWTSAVAEKARSAANGWFVQCDRKLSAFNGHPFNGLESEDTWAFSSTMSTIPLEPGFCRLLCISPSRLSKYFDVVDFLKPESTTITVELTVMSSPYVEVEVDWLPFSNLDEKLLQLYPPARPLLLEMAPLSIDGEESCLVITPPLVADRRKGRSMRIALGSSSSNNNNNSEFNSLRSATTQTASSSSLSTNEPVLAREDEGVPLFHAEQQVSPGSETSLLRQNECAGGDGAGAADGFHGGVSVCDFSSKEEDEVDLGGVLAATRERAASLMRKPNRYMKILQELSEALFDLQTQLSAAQPLLDEYLSSTFRCLDGAIEAGNPAEVAAGAKPHPSISMTTSWTDLDLLIKWHLKNVDLLIESLAFSARIYLDNDNLLETGSPSNSSILCIREDLIAMALQAQTEILADVTGVALNFAELGDAFGVMAQSHCLAYGGIPGKRSHHEVLFPRRFWLNLIWDGSDAAHYRQSNAVSMQPKLMVNRIDLHEFLLAEYEGLQTEDENALIDAVDNLIEQLSDLDLTDANPWQAIPLTQLCHRLKLHNATLNKTMSTAKLTTGSFLNRSTHVFQTDLPAEPSLTLALKYLLGQVELQYSLRESDDERLFRNLEGLVDSLISPPTSSDQRTDIVSMSVANIICLAFALQHEDSSVTTFASRAICVLEDYTRDAYGISLKSKPLPFLRTNGPCYCFLKALEQFIETNAEIYTSAQRKTLLRRKISLFDAAKSNDYKRITPIGAALLWGMHPVTNEDYRLAALAAWECLTTPSEASIGHRQNRYSRQANRRGASAGANPIQTEVKHMNLSDEDARVRRMALRILMANSRFKSTVDILDF